MTFKMQLFSLTGTLQLQFIILLSVNYTGVPPDRQKLMIGGVAIGNEEWDKATTKIKQVMLCCLLLKFLKVILELYFHVNGIC